MRIAKVRHGILQISEISEKVFTYFGDGFDLGRRGDGCAVGVVDFDFAFLRSAGVGGRGVPRDERGDHDEEENDSEREGGEELWVEADKGVDCHCREGMCRVAPA